MFREVISSGMKPDLVSSLATCTSSNTFMRRPIFSASRLMTSSKRTLSTEWIICTKGTICLTLFVCKCPMKCQRISAGSACCLSNNSCTLLSPKSRSPQSYAACIDSIGWNLLTQINVTPLGMVARIEAICCSMWFKIVQCSATLNAKRWTILNSATRYYYTARNTSRIGDRVMLTTSQSRLLSACCKVLLASVTLPACT